MRKISPEARSGDAIELHEGERVYIIHQPKDGEPHYKSYSTGGDAIVITESALNEGGLRDIALRLGHSEPLSKEDLRSILGVIKR